MPADFSRVPDYAVVDPTRNWYQIVVSNSARPLYAEESPTMIIRRFQSENEVSPADGVIRDSTLAALERLVAAGARQSPSDTAAMFVASIQDDRARFRRSPQGSLSEPVWKAMIWGSREDLRQSPQALFDGAVRLDAFKSSKDIRMPLFGVDLPVAPGAFVATAKPQPDPPAPLQVAPPQAGTQPLPGGSTSSLAAQVSTSAVSLANIGGSTPPWVGYAIAGTVSVAALAILWAVLKREVDSPSARPSSQT